MTFCRETFLKTQRTQWLVWEGLWDVRRQLSELAFKLGSR